MTPSRSLAEPEVITSLTALDAALAAAGTLIITIAHNTTAVPIR
jgi:hypothetical protein